MNRDQKMLTTVKSAHTLIWAFFGSCVFAIPLAAWWGRTDWVLWLNAILSVELFILAFYRCRCPLTAIAARYTTDRRDNFDIFLPNWLARYNKEIFGTVLVLGDLYAWLR
jgi:hypothetical protein